MKTKYVTILESAYDAFNNRDIPRVLSFLHSRVKWSNGWEGGYVHGPKAVEDYWKRQWKELNPAVVPVEFSELDNRVNTLVHQLVSDLTGNVLFDGKVRHVYTFQDDLILQMDIEPHLENE